MGKRFKTIIEQVYNHGTTYFDFSKSVDKFSVDKSLTYDYLSQSVDKFSGHCADILIFKLIQVYLPNKSIREVA